MAILNVVQPEEFAPSSFTTVDGKLKVAISGDVDNILEYKEDGLYAKASSSGGVLGRYTYHADELGVVIHKGIKFSLRNIDGAISGEISGVDINDITEDDVIYNVSDRVAEGPHSDDSKLLLYIPWAVEKAQRFIIRLMRSGVAEMWVVQVATPTHVASLNGFQGITITIDEMANMGDLSSNAEELPQVPPEGDITILGYCRTPMGIRTAIIGRGGNRIGVARIEGGEGDVSIANTRFGTLGVNYLELMTQNPKAHIGYCAITGYLIYHNGDKYNVMIEGDTPVAVNLPKPDYDTGIVGIGIAISDLGDAAFVYTMDAQSFSYQEIIDTDPLEFSAVTTIDAPTDGVIKDYVVSGSKAHYLLVKNGTYVLHTTDLYTKEVTENVIMVYSDTDGDVKLINGGLGSAFAYIDKTQAQVIVGVVASMNMADFKLNLTPVDPIILDGPLLSIDPLRQISFQLDQTYSIYGMFISPSNMSILRLSTNLMTGGLEKATAPLPQNYLSLLVGGAMAVPFTDTITSIAYDASEDGSRMTFEELEIGDAGGGMYQSLAMFQRPDAYFVLTISMSGELSMFPFTPSNNKLIKLNVLRDSANQLMDNTIGAPIVVHHESGSFTFLDKNFNVVLASPDLEVDSYSLTVLGQADQNRPADRLVLNQSLTEEGRFVTAWFTNTREVTVYKVAPDLTVTTDAIGLEELPEEIELDESYYASRCQVDKYLIYALPANRGGEKAINELLIIDLVTGTKKVVFHSEDDNWMTLRLAAISDALFTTDVGLEPVASDVENYQQRKLWKIESDLSITEMDTLNLPSFNKNETVANSQRYLTVNGGVHHDIGILANSESPKYIDVVTHIPSAKMSFNLLSPTEEMIKAAGIFLDNGAPLLAYFQFDEMGQPIGLFIQGDFSLSNFAYHSFAAP